MISSAEAPSILKKPSKLPKEKRKGIEQLLLQEHIYETPPPTQQNNCLLQRKVSQDSLEITLDFGKPARSRPPR